MPGAIKVDGYFYRGTWNEVWHYPASGSLLALDRDFPALRPFYLGIETKFDAVQLMLLTRRYYWAAYLVVALYLLFVFYGPKVMKHRKAFDLRTPLRYWNLLLALFSFWGVVRIVPHLAYFIYKVGFINTLCSAPIWGYGSGASGFWTVLFIYSKFVELLDTVFIVLRKRQLSFLHWYHHATVLLYTWDAFVNEQPPGIYYCAMNYTVHAVMYSYYYLASTMRKAPKWGRFVTMLQISQMIIGVLLTCYSLFLAFKYPFLSTSWSSTAFRPLEQSACYLSKGNLLSCMAMYSTYFYLFAVFFYNRYVSKCPPTVSVCKPTTSSIGEAENIKKSHTGQLRQDEESSLESPATTADTSDAGESSSPLQSPDSNPAIDREVDRSGGGVPRRRRPVAATGSSSRVSRSNQVPLAATPAAPFVATTQAAKVPA